MRESMPHGFRRSVGTGLIVPEEHSREREVWTRDEYRLVDRATKLLQSRKLKVFFGCTEPGCQEAPMERLRNPDGGITLRCAHKDRVVTKL